MRQKREYKSPYAAMLWSMLLPGFGQFYNKDYLVGVVLIAFEILVNLNSNLNLALVHSFHGDFTQAHDVIDYRWGMFYPSLYGFSIWQAFNAARANNDRKFHGQASRRTYLSGFFAGMVVGMDLGLFWHDYTFFQHSRLFFFLDMPVFNGLFYGLLFGILGCTFERTIYRKRRAAQLQKESTQES
ncbi:hypothetical protein ACWM35_20535 [Neobacillus sp. K501]